MIRFTLTQEIHAPLPFVIRLFEDRSRLAEWQHGFISEEKIKDGKDGIQYKLVYKAGNRNINFIETVSHNDVPGQYDVMYRMKGMKNFVQNHFTSRGDSVTMWESKHTFRFRWLMMLVGPRMRKELEQQSKMLMNHFKVFVESENVRK